MSNTGKFRQNINAKITSNNKKDIKAATLREVLGDAADAIDEIFETFSLVDGLGTYNASTGVATIKETGATFTPVLVANQANGKFFNIEVEGTQSITGSSKLMKVGGMLVSRGTKWDYIPPADTGYQKVVNLEKSLPENTSKDRWMFPFLTLSKRLLGGFEIDGAWNALKYKVQSIPGAALKNAEITYDKLHANVISAFATITDLIPYEAAKSRFPVNPNPTDYAFPFVTNSKRLLGYVDKDGTFVFFKFRYSLPGMLAKLSPLYGEKFVSLGDSITAGKQWQPLLSQLTGMVWSAEETTPGVGGIPPMGVAGSRIVPEIISGESGRNAGQSIYYRAGFVHLYSPKVILLFGGQNDDTSSLSIGNIADAPYTGDEIVQGAGTLPSFISAYKGTLVKLLANNPNAKIYAMTRMWNGVGSAALTDSAYTATMRINTAIKDVCARYSVTVIDLFQEVGITPYNASIYFSDNVHPNEEGGKKMARIIKNYLN